MLSKPIPMNPELAALLERAKNHVMTPAEIAAQRRSWVRGELMLADDSLTAAEADRRITAALVSMGLSEAE